MRQDKRRVKYTMVIAPQRYHSKPLDISGGHEGCRAPVERFYELLGAKASERKLARDAAVAETLLAEGFSLEDLTFMPARPPAIRATVISGATSNPTSRPWLKPLMNWSNPLR
jgi:hypothetical protein